MDTRHKIIDSWRQKGLNAQENEEYFDAFISYWISFVVSCKVYCDNNGVRFQNHEDGINAPDSSYIIEWFRGNSGSVITCFDDNLPTLSLLKDRNHGEILAQTYQGQFQYVTRALRGENKSNFRVKLIENLAYLLIKIRNNLFHGVKIYDDQEDLQLIQSVLPFLRDLLDSSNSFLLQ